VVIRATDTLDDLKRKIKLATILGTLQSTLSNFRYLRSVWQRNQEEERLLGVSFTGIMDHPVMNGTAGYDKLTEWLHQLKQHSRTTNEEWASKLGINKSLQLGLTKPSGTVSQLCSTASGIHPRFSEYYIRRVRQDSKDPLTQFMITTGIPYVVDGEKTIFSFYVKSPEGAITADSMGAMDQLKLWKIYRDEYCEGNPSQTIYYTDDDFLTLQDWIWKNWDSVGGLSFFPLDGSVYENQPYESISKEEYERLQAPFPPNIDWSGLTLVEKEDSTQEQHEYACSGGQCDI